MTNDPFAGMDDDLDGAPLGQTKKADTTLADAQVARYEESCPSCHGSGRFVGYSGRSLGSCFKCNGTGRLAFKTSPDYRAKAKTAYAARKERDAAVVRDNVKVFAEAFAADYEWMLAKRDRFEFAANMCDTLVRYGYLTEKQHAAVTRLRIADADRDATRAAEAVARVVNAPAIDISAIETAFAHAKGKGIKKPKMKLAGFKFSEAPAHGVNAGSLYVVRVEDDQYLGKIAGGKFVKVRDCNDAAQAEVLAVAADPHNAAIAYGRRTGSCAICSRELTNHASIDLGIGPICAEKYGWL